MKITQILAFLVIGASFYVINLSKAGPFEPLHCYLFSLDCMKNTYVIQGEVKKGYENVRKVFEDQWLKGRMVDGQIVVYKNGEKVVDIWGKSKTTKSERPYTPDSIQLVFSTSKVVVLLSLAMGMERGYFNYEDPVAKYWPEFGANGKENITIRDVALHQAGLCGAFIPLPMENIMNLDFISNVLANATPVWPHDTKTCYHGFSIGWLVEEIIRRTDPKKRTLGEFVQDEITGPLQADFFIKVPPQNQTQVYPVYYPSEVWTFSKVLVPFFLGTADATQVVQVKNSFNSSSFNTMMGSGANANLIINTTFMNSPDMLKIYSPGTAGFASGRGLARIGAALANYGELDGVRILKKETLEKLLVTHPPAYEFSVGATLVLAQTGWALGGGKSTFLLPDGYYGWPGLGGSVLLFNPKENVSIGFTVTGLDRTNIYPQSVYEISRSLPKM